MNRDSEDQETELFKNENLRICMILKRFDENPHLFNILYRYYSLNDPLTFVELNVSRISLLNHVFRLVLLSILL